MELLTVIFWLGVILSTIALWLLPIYIAIARKHPQFVPILLITVLLGWTFLGWIGALVWSVASFKREAAASSSAP